MDSRVRPKGRTKGRWAARGSYTGHERTHRLHQEQDKMPHMQAAWTLETAVSDEKQGRGRTAAASSTAETSTTNDVRYTDVLSFDEYQDLKPIPGHGGGEAGRAAGQSQWINGKSAKTAGGSGESAARMGMFAPEGVPGCPVDASRLQPAHRDALLGRPDQQELFQNVDGCDKV